MSERAKAIEQARCRMEADEYVYEPNVITYRFSRQRMDDACLLAEAYLSLSAAPAEEVSDSLTITRALLEVVTAERDQLRAENERLRKEQKELRRELAVLYKVTQPEELRLYQEELQHVRDLESEIERLRAENGERVDDGEAVTEDWLRNIGGTRPMEAVGITKLVFGTWQNNHYPLMFRKGGRAKEWTVYCGGCSVFPKTRGDVRRLCSALGITLNERTVSE